MKRNLLAIAIPALLIAGTANASIEIWNKDCNKIDLYGRVKAANYFTDRHQTREGDHTSARIGIIGQTQISDDLIGYGRIEWETKTHNNDSEYSNIQTRYAFAGLNFGDYGSFDYGRNDGVLKAITAYTDVLPEFGGDASDRGLYVLSARTKAVATYRNNNFFGLNDDISFALQYADNGDATDLVNNRSRAREAWGTNVQWQLWDTGLTVGAGYAQTAKNSSSDFKRANTWTAGIKYDANDLYLAATYFHSKYKTTSAYHDVKVNGFEVVAQYTFELENGSRLQPSLAYVQHKMKNGSSHYNGDVAKYVSLGATYQFNKNMSFIAEYQFNLLKKDSIGAKALVNGYQGDNEKAGNYKYGTKDVLALGLIYQF